MTNFIQSPVIVEDRDLFYVFRINSKGTNYQGVTLVSAGQWEMIQVCSTYEEANEFVRNVR